MRRLPPLTAIEAFVQVARTGSVKGAAEALSLSSPALSRRLQSLERHVGHPLFERRHQSVRLNPEGERLLVEVGPSLDALGLAIERARGERELMRLRLSVLPLFASQRLMPRLAELRAAHPELHIDIDTAAHGLARLDEGVDAAIVLTSEVDSSLYARRIDVNQIVAIAAADLGYTRPADLAAATVFLHRDMADIFDMWRDAMGVSGLQPAAIDYFDSGPLMLEAAAQGLGVALMLDSHFRDAHDPRMVELFGARIDTPYGYWFACRRSALGRRPVRIFHDWLFASIAGSGELKAAA
ncbi:LysR substrate-binding domain-containing protein [Allosphingosinicella indica]|uniref:LysR family transcriptional regulator, glycine cleavage system transcriptional activator n=1 Tax=Allosphingosinicella indica TaxID=941907 RepID=A0A1X7G3A6_9SPHN|nr:LysR substrate-binding domain-containing protein [Allosphingosinicella indica]SMF63332.1 LysR family transcriptional regulator, glycine cleavage system transcriptional activator [Allosphingosinicella indica]